MEGRRIYEVLPSSEKVQSFDASKILHVNSKRAFSPSDINIMSNVSYTGINQYWSTGPSHARHMTLPPRQR